MPKQPEGMFAQVRRQAVIETVNREGNVTVTELCKRLGVSPATIRNDLRELELAGAIERAHGGAMAVGKAVFELTSTQKRVKNVAEKEAIAQAARAFIEPGDAIALDTGTTTFELAKRLGGIEGLTVVTNDLQIAVWLEGNTSANVILAGGTLRQGYNCTMGKIALDNFRGMHVDKAFVAANGVSPEVGLSTPNMEMASVKAALIASARKVILLADSTKINRDALVSYAALDEVHVMITDAKADETFLQEAGKAGLTIIKAKLTINNKKQK